MTIKRFINGVLVLILMMLSFGLTAQNQEIKVVIDNIRDDQGTIWVALHKPGEEFMKERYKWFKVAAQKGTVTGFFSDIPPGTYGISVMHDANNNREVDKNAIGIPTEGVGFSNNAMGRFGPPDFKKIAFEVPKLKELVVNMKYM